MSNYYNSDPNKGFKMTSQDEEEARELRKLSLRYTLLWFATIPTIIFLVFRDQYLLALFTIIISFISLFLCGWYEYQARQAEDE